MPQFVDCTHVLVVKSTDCSSSLHSLLGALAHTCQQPCQTALGSIESSTGDSHAGCIQKSADGRDGGALV
jgi:hypothetical protein